MEEAALEQKMSASRSRQTADRDTADMELFLQVRACYLPALHWSLSSAKKAIC